MDNRKNYVGIGFLVIILLTFIVGGYFLMRYMTSGDNDKKETNEPGVATVDLRIDKTKDYIYYASSEDVIANEEIHREEVILNFQGLESLNEQLKNETNELYKNIKYEKDVTLPEEDEDGNEINYQKNEEGIYSLKYRSYENFKYNDYVSLKAVDYDYDIINGSVPFEVKCYVVNINDGYVLSEEELLSIFNLSSDVIATKVKERLNNTQVLSDDKEVIDVNGTLKDLKYSLYITKNGELAVTFLVKSNQNNYNDSVVLN